MARTVVGKGTPPIHLERLGRYRIVRPLSKGGMALVFEARRESLAGVSPRVAIKLILPEHADSDTFQELFINEARLGASMHHQNLVQIQDFDRDDEHFFLVMEYVEGLTLRQIVSLCVRSERPIPMGVVAEIGRQACDGLHYAHQATDERGVHLALVHRDVKPSNLMLNPHGVVKILDFGISKGNLLSERAGAVRGTWGYMAPEQAFGRDVGPNADVFGLATILYEMASRKPLFRKKSPDEIKRLLDDDHAARMAATLPAEYGPLVSVLVRALQRDPVARYATAADFGRALSALLPDPITARDEVVSFFKGIDALEQGRPAPPPAGRGAKDAGLGLPGPGALSAPSQASLVATSVTTSERRGLPWGWIVAGVVGSLLLAVAGTAIGVWWATGPGEGPRGGVLDLDMVEAPGVVSVPVDEGGEPDDAPPDPTVAEAPDEAPAPAATGERPPPAITVPPPGTSSTPDEAAAVQTDPGSAEAATEPEPPPEEPVVVRIDRRSPQVRIVEVDPEADPESAEPGTSEEPASGTTPDEAPAAEDPAPDEAGVGWITLAAQPYGTDYDVFIDGKLVPRAGPNSPLVRHELTAGEHFVTISAAGGARKQFEVTIAADQHVRKIWDFERNQWRR